MDTNQRQHSSQTCLIFLNKTSSLCVWIRYSVLMSIKRIHLWDSKPEIRASWNILENCIFITKSEDRYCQVPKDKQHTGLLSQNMQSLSRSGLLSQVRGIVQTVYKLKAMKNSNWPERWCLQRTFETGFKLGEEIKLQTRIKTSSWEDQIRAGIGFPGRQ